MPRGAVRSYVRNEFEQGESALDPWSRVKKPFDTGRALVSEVLNEILKKDYRYIVSKYGYGLSLNGTAQLTEVTQRFRHKLRYLYVHSYSKKWLRPDELLDFSLILPLSNLRGLSVGYMLNSRNASAIERIDSLECLSLAWKIDEPADLTKLERLRELAIFASPYLESVWHLSSLQKLAISNCREETLAAASRLTNVEKLVVRESRTLASIKGIGNLHELQFLGLYGNSSLKTVGFVSDAKSLEYIVIENCSVLNDIDEALDLPNLRYLEVRDCPSLKSVKVFPAHPNLTHVFFVGSTRPERSVEEIVTNLPNLKYYFD